MKEIWKPIKNYEGYYELSNYGEIKSLIRAVKYKNSYKVIRGRVMKCGINTNGYRQVNLSKNKIRKTYSIAPLVWNYFDGTSRDGLDLDHIDNNKQNDRIDNLQLLTHKQNTLKGWRNKKNISRK